MTTARPVRAPCGGVASGVNAPEQRPSASGATARRAAHGLAAGRCWRSRAASWVVAMSGAFGRCLRPPEGEPMAGPDADRLCALHARDASGQFGPPAARCPSPRLPAGGWPIYGRCHRQLHRPLRRIRAPCGDRRLERESARTAHIGERRHRGKGARRSRAARRDDGAERSYPGDSRLVCGESAA